MSAEFEFYLPVKIIFGEGRVRLLSDEIRRLGGKKIFLVTGKKSVRASGLLDTIAKSLRENGIDLVLFDRVHPDPDTFLVDEGLRLGRAEGCDAIVGVGGGSALDCAKAIAGLSGEQNFSSSIDYLEIDGTKNVSKPGLPFISVPTVSGTGAEVTKNAVLVNPAANRKRSIRHPHMFPKTCICDPQLTLSVPRRQAVVSGIDAFCHLIEGYVTKRGNPLAETLALEGLINLKDSLVELHKSGSNLELCGRMALASLLGGAVIANSTLTLAHGIGSVIGPKFNIPHGVACSLFLSRIMRYNWEYIPVSKQEQLRRVFGEDVPKYIDGLLKGLDLPTTASDVGIAIGELKKLAVQSLDTSSGKGNPRPANPDEVTKLLM